ncbi:hypothetical protein QU577_18375 [Priestia megaterium]|uniref:uracil-DNA glycosylase family protein n=1 Tax=Priestia TaxID=2800373 RepID=UPI0015F3BA18|nr:uracil-DNA glycosylase family protein [Priestia megaterium]MDN3363735.1 hypothetical protein [Priestia megaterium]
MTIANYAKFHQFKEIIQSLPSVSESSIVSEQFLLEKDEKKQLEIYYAPFEYINERAKVVIVGITPGLNQMEQSYQTVFNDKDKGKDAELILSQVKNNSSFEGPMRKNLVSMLDKLGLHQYLGLSSTIELFNKASNLVHTTSVITYPVFHKGKNYGGTTPDMLKTNILKKYVTEGLVAELEQLDRPLVIPLGVKVEKAINYLVDQKILDPTLILSGFPHPSGQNGWRERHFEAAKEKMLEKLQAHFQSDN